MILMASDRELDVDCAGTMAKQSDEWKVLNHGPIEQLTDNLWRVVGSIPRMSLKRVMTIAKMCDLRLVFHSPIALDEHTMAEIEQWGPPAYVIVPGGYHRMDSPAYKKRYPAVRVLAPRGSRAKVEEVMSVDGTYEDFPEDTSVAFQMIPGIDEREGAMIVRSSDGVTVVLNDVVMNMDRKRDPLGFLFTTLMGSAPGPRVSRLAKLALVKDKQALRVEFERLAAIPNLVRLVVSHENVASGKDAAEALRKAATFL